ncbi:MAG: dephospho-CoA kinase [Herpetosiphon sp.]
MDQLPAGMGVERFAHLYVIGLTGNIGCGKSAVVDMLAALGAAVIDADQVTRQIMEVGQPAYEAIVAHFGSDVLATPGGPIDRPALGRLVFGDAQRLRELEAIVHPATRAFVWRWLAEKDRRARDAGHPQVAVVDAIKLIESRWPAVCDAVWVVYCDPAVQLARLVQQRGMSEADARQRIEAQPPQRDKLAVADVAIANDGTLDELQQRVRTAWQALTLP